MSCMAPIRAKSIRAGTSLPSARWLSRDEKTRRRGATGPLTNANASPISEICSQTSASGRPTTESVAPTNARVRQSNASTSGSNASINERIVGNPLPAEITLTSGERWPTRDDR